MLILKNNLTNRAVVTFTENTTLTGSTYYLWSVISDDTNDSVEFISDDLSTNEFRYNEFNIILTSGTTNPTGGTISNLDLGTYKYNAYQQNSNTNLTVSLSGDIVEKGRIYVSGATVPSVTTYESTGNTNNIVYTS